MGARSTRSDGGDNPASSSGLRHGVQQLIAVGPVGAAELGPEACTSFYNDVLSIPAADQISCGNFVLVVRGRPAPDWTRAGESDVRRIQPRSFTARIYRIMPAERLTGRQRQWCIRCSLTQCFGRVGSTHTRQPHSAHIFTQTLLAREHCNAVPTTLRSACKAAQQPSHLSPRLARSHCVHRVSLFRPSNSRVCQPTPPPDASIPQPPGADLSTTAAASELHNALPCIDDRVPHTAPCPPSLSIDMLIPLPGH